MINKALKYKQLSETERILFWNACFKRVKYWFIIQLLPYRFYKSKLGIFGAETKTTISQETENMANLVSKAVKRSSVYLPPFRKCLIDAIVAKKILEEKDIKSTLYLGVRKDTKSKLKAHAWLRCGEIIVTGARGMAKYKPVSSFA